MRIRFFIAVLFLSLSCWADSNDYSSGMSQQGYYNYKGLTFKNRTLIGLIGESQVYGNWMGYTDTSMPFGQDIPTEAHDFYYGYMIGDRRKGEIEEYYTYGTNHSFDVYPIDTIGASALADINNLTTVSGEQIVIIEDGAFQNSGLIDMSIFPLVIKIGDYSFSNTHLVTLNHFPALMEMGESAFEGCQFLVSATLSPTLVKMGKRAFMNCPKLETVNLYTCPLLHEIPELAFYNCEDLEEVNLPSSVEKIDSEAFRYCQALKKLVLGKHVDYVGDGAFANCTKLKYVFLEGDISSLDVSAFSGCENIQEIRVTNTSNTPPLSELFMSSRSNIQNVRLESGSTCLGSSDDSWATGTFQEFTALTNLDVPESVSYIGYNTFRGCSSLTSISLPSTLEKIYGGAFVGCKSLNSIFCLSESVPELDEYAFDDLDFSKISLYVPEEAIQRYRNANGWKDFHNILPITSATTTLKSSSEKVNSIYKINGQKVHNISQRGTYIINGKKITK